MTLTSRRACCLCDGSSPALVKTTLNLECYIRGLFTPVCNISALAAFSLVNDSSAGK